MKTFGKFLIGVVVLMFFGCSNEDDKVSIIENCTRIKDAKILAEGEGCCAVFGAGVYRFENELYTVQGFCSCDEFFLFTTKNPINCDGIELCDEVEFENIQNCLSQLKFYENAEYLFNITLD